METTEGSSSGGPAVCGDGVVDAGETCDDGNLADDDACSSDCAQVFEVLQISAGYHHVCLRITGGRVKCWGFNGSGELGQGDTEHRGDDPGELGAALPYVDLGTGLAAVQVLAAGATSCALFADGRVKCWGDNNAGQCGVPGWMVNLGDEPGEMGDALPFIDLGAGLHAVAVGGRQASLCVQTDDGKIKCWASGINGSNGHANPSNVGEDPGEMGDALPFTSVGGTVTELWPGYDHHCVQLGGEALKCWGHNANGLLGLGDTAIRGDSLAEMGNALPAVDLGATPLAVAPGLRHVCARFDGGGVKCWGEGYKLGLGTTSDRGDQPGEMGMNLPYVDVGGPVAAIGAGVGMTCALLVGGQVKCWGQNVVGGLGLGDLEVRGDAPGEMGDALPAVDLGAAAVAVELAVGASYACVRLADGAVKCWGDGSYVQLGQGDKEDRGDGPGEMGDALLPVQVF